MENVVEYKQAISKGRYRAILNEREHLVVPVIMAKEIVMNDVFYSSKELSKIVSIWNGVPVPVNHPRHEGIETTSSTPQEEEKRNVGRVYNAKYEDNKLKGEVWIDIDKTKKMGYVNLLNRLENNEVVNVSIGVKGDIREEKGFYGGKAYSKTIHNLRADHLALLPDSVGACSIDEGCGANLLNKKEGCGCESCAGIENKNKEEIKMDEDEKKKNPKDEKLEGVENKAEEKTEAKGSDGNEAKSETIESKDNKQETVTIPVKEYTQLVEFANKKEFLSNLENEYNERISNMKNVVSEAHPYLKEQVDSLNVESLKALYNNAVSGTSYEGRVGSGTIANSQNKDTKDYAPAGLLFNEKYKENLNGKGK